MENQIIAQFLKDIAAQAPETVLFIGFFVQLLFLSAPDKLSKFSLPFGYFTWAFFSFYFLKNGIFEGISFSGHLKNNPETYFVKLLMLVSVLLILFHFMISSVRNKEKLHLIFTGLFLGCLLLIQANSFFTFLISLEMISIPAYALANFGFDKDSSQSSLKYFIFGATSTAITIFGISWVYGFSGTLSFTSIISDGNHLFFSVALLMIGIGLLFKLSSFPIHAWAPKMYENAPNLVLSILSTFPKIASGFFFIKFFSLFPSNEFLIHFVAISAIGTLVVGTAGATVQKNFKNMMGYSSIANSGFFLAIVLLPKESQMLAFWIFASSQLFANIGIFFVLDELKFRSYDINNWNGLGKKNRLIVACLAISLISLIGLPPLAGFQGKLLTIIGLFNTNHIPNILSVLLGLTLIMSTLMSLYFYLNPVYRLIVRENEENILPVRFNWLNVIFTTLIIVSLIIIFFKVGELGNYLELSK